MAENSGIQWTDHTFNPWIGCTKVSPGCANCYAKTLMDDRHGRVKWGPKGERSRTSEGNWRKPLTWDRHAREAGRVDRVFCASLADVFEDRPELSPWRDELWALIEATPNLVWQLLTKRPENIMAMVPESWRAGFPPNVHVGTSVEDQATANTRIPHLLKVPAALLFLSCEPLLGPVDLTNLEVEDGGPGQAYLDSLLCEFNTGDDPDYSGRMVGWVIVGGESGPGARPFDLRWARDIVSQCRASFVPVFVKQLGARPVLDGVPIPCKGKGGDVEDWPADLRVREFPGGAEDV